MRDADLKTLFELVNVAVADSEKRLLKEVNRAVEFHRRAVYVRDRWCCGTMENFATKVWGQSRPVREHDHAFGSVTLQIRGETVNYCPFCGVFVGRDDT